MPDVRTLNLEQFFTESDVNEACANFVARSRARLQHVASILSKRARHPSKIAACLHSTLEQLADEVDEAKDERGIALSKARTAALLRRPPPRQCRKACASRSRDFRVLD